MPEERLLSIGSRGRLSPEDVARHTFSTNRRGFEQSEVRSFLEMVARELEALLEQERELRRALAEAEHRAANPILDEATLTTALGQETARVLRSAHDAAGEITARAESDAARLRAEAEEEAEQIRSRAERLAAERGAQVEAAATEMRRRLQEEEQSRLESAKLEAEALVSQARAECRAMVQEAQELRARVLSDLTRRRRILHSQIEQLRAGRERLAQTIGDVRHVVDRVTDELLRAEDEARLAAEAAGRHVGGDEDLASPAPAPPPAVPAAAPAAAPAAPPAPPAAAAPAAAAAAAAAPAAAAPAQAAEEDRRHAVDELFARLRAEQAPGPGEGADVGGPVAGTPPVEGGDAPAGDPVVAAEQDPTVAEQDPTVARRDELLAPVVAGLARRLKRVLADDQNDLLDRLRARGRFDAEVLGSESEHERRYREAAEPVLAEAAGAGARFAGGSPASAPPVTETAGELARAIVAPLRRRLLDPSLGAEEGDEAAVADHVGSAFREWKGQRIERVAADHAHGAFWSAALAASPGGQLLHWVVDDDGMPCPDCDDNALAGSLPAGETFPTGHLHPPAHPGCRCLLSPGPA